MKKSLLPLALGTFGLGMAEFVMMSILPYVAKDMAVSIPAAGHLISAYALGVCVGAPLMLLIARKFPLKTVLFFLIAIYAMGNAFAGLSHNYWVMMTMRFVSGLPHGAFFGVGSIVAEKLADKGKSARAVAFMVSGMTVANLIGIPLGAYICNHFSWRYIFYITGIWGSLNLVALLKWMPSIPPLPNDGFRRQFRFLKNPEPWYILLATGLGNCGIFCYYCYISPLMTDMSGFQLDDITWIMVISGVSMVIGNILGGKLSDKFSSAGVVQLAYTMAAIALIIIFFLPHISIISITMMSVATCCLFMVGAPNQLLVIQNSRGGEMMGAAFIQVAFNLGNALGSYSGGLSIDYKIGVNYASIIGTGYLIIAVLFVSLLVKRQKRVQTIPVRS